ncbi:PIN domain-containing protein [Halobacteria archaeon AArc-m2/3/4]|uniref:PIN domain-containing protein n=1 Tax=Natronoglomus mannanivorans TaxID=2979990 RepID=A0AAP2YVS2_9EURY|nr:PIN domain-containing protein [Halobacteria archaeon AArc-xg1-1]MCU4971454.1 PIN domain-containing protein [Halobacteria archaeon AArc-m2/3/4]
MLIDANVFLEVQLDQGRADEAQRFLERVADGEVGATVTHFHVDAIAYILEQRGNDGAVETFLLSLLGYDGLSVVTQSVAEKAMACRLFDRYDSLDFDDALAVQAALALEEPTVVSYDTDFDTVSIVERTMP